MNHRVSVSVALALGGAVGALLTHSVPQAQAQAQTPAHAAPAAPPPGVQAQLDRMQAQIAALQAEVNRLRTQFSSAARGLPAMPPSAYSPPLYVYPSPAPGGQAPKTLTVPPASGYTPYLYINPNQPAAPAPERRFTNIPPTRIIPLGESTGGAGTQPLR